MANVATLLVTIGLTAGHLVPAGPAKADDPARAMFRPSRPRRAPLGPRKKVVMEGSLTIRGRVLDPDGKPFAGARSTLIGTTGPADADIFFAPGPPRPIATSDADGRFQFAIPDPGFDTLQVQATWTHPTVAALARDSGRPGPPSPQTDEARDMTLKLVQR